MHAAVCIVCIQDDGKTKENSVANIIVSSSQMASLWNETNGALSIQFKGMNCMFSGTRHYQLVQEGDLMVL